MGHSCLSKETDHVTENVRKQGSKCMGELYKWVDLNNGGELIELCRKAYLTGDYSRLDERIKSRSFRSFLYNEGEGRSIPLIDILNYRDGKDYGDLEEPHGFERKLRSTVYHVKHIENQQYKEVCWRTDKRGTVGETILHLCFLNATAIHADLAKRLIHHYPKLVYDFYMGDMYFGETVLHLAIVNEDPAMVKFLLDNGADVHQRCCGSFFCPADQKKSRSGAHDREWLSVCKETNYEGHTYWGESPLGFAACVGQEECVRLLVAKGADLNFQDANGNTVLHMAVIYEKKEMFSLLHSLGSRLDIKNRQDLTPLTLAAKLARKEMYELILEIEREEYWIYGNVTCAGYPLEHIDTISQTGEINKNSALALIVYGEKPGHLEMMDGLVVYVLQEKWRTFIRFRFYRRLVIFLLYFLTFVLAFLLRPGTDLQPTVTTKNVTDNGNVTEVQETTIDPCYLMKPYRGEDIARFVLEGIIYLGSVLYILLALKESYHQGPQIFLTTLKGAPTKALFLCSCLFVILMLPGRAACAYQYEDIMGVLAILCTAPYFLFFCRGFRIVGPFVVMIYNMIRGDLLRFFMIYAVFVIGFSQAFYIAFLGVTKHTVFTSGLETMLALLTMATGEFEDFVEEFPESRHFQLLNVVFFVYMIMVTLLLVNMLIAMMGNTYQLINNTQKEWFRQWANIVLVIEQSVTTAHRREKQLAYSQPMSNDAKKRVLVSRWHQTEEEKAALKLKRDLAHCRDKNLGQKKKEMTSTVKVDQNIEARMSGPRYVQH